MGRWGAMVMLALLLAGCAEWRYLANEPRDQGAGYQTELRTLPARARCLLEGGAGQRQVVETPMRLPLAAFADPISATCEAPGYFPRKVLVPRGAPDPLIRKLLRGGVISPLHGPWPPARERQGAIYPRWLEIVLVPRTFPSLAARDRYFAAQAAARSNAWAALRTRVVHECLAGFGGAPAPNRQNLPAPCVRALERLAKLRARELDALEIDRRRTGLE